MGTGAPKPAMKTEGLVLEYKLEPHQLTERLTPEPDLFVLAHLGIPAVTKEDWQLVVDGLVDRALTIGFDDLLRRPKKVVETVHQCAGNPMDPTVPTRQIANVRWTGVDLRDLLAETGLRPSASHVWAYGPDHGAFAGEEQDCYLKDVPLFRIEDGDVMVAYELNGEPLSEKHGFPARLVVPGYFATNSVKWLHRLQVADRRAGSIFTTRFYNDPIADSDATRPVWDITPESLIVAPAEKSRMSTGDTEVWGWAWSSTDVVKVEVSVDGGTSWNEAKIEPRSHRSWQRFSFDWSARRTGTHDLLSRATDKLGHTQPMEGARNSVYVVSVDVKD